MITEKDRQYFGLAQDIANRFSRDESTKVGCIIIDPNTFNILSTGYNGFPRGVVETPERKQRPEKYIYTNHAERNAIDNAARVGSKLDGGTAYVTLFPCHDCTKGLIQAGIKRLVVEKPTNERWIDSSKLAEEMLREVDIEIDYIYNDFNEIRNY